MSNIDSWMSFVTCCLLTVILAMMAIRMFLIEKMVGKLARAIDEMEEKNATNTSTGNADDHDSEMYVRLG